MVDNIENISQTMSGTTKEGQESDAPASDLRQPDAKKDKEEEEAEQVNEQSKGEGPRKSKESDDKEPEATLEAAEDMEEQNGPKPGRRATVHLEVGSMAFDLDVPEEFADSTKRKSLMNDEEFLQAKGEDVTIWMPVRRINSNTCQCCGIMCGMWILSFVVLVVASMALGSIQFDIGVPFYDRAEINEQREDAYLATQRDADFVATIKNTADGKSVCVHDAPTIMTRNGTLLEGPAPGENCQLASTQSLRIMYISSDRESNILTTENLQQIHKIEQEFLAHTHLSKYCHLIPSNYSAFTGK